MARKLNDIQQSILDKIATSAELTALEVLTTSEKSTLAEITSASKVAVWRTFVYVVAFCIYVFELILDVFRAEITAKVSANRPHTLDWYKTKALAFQYGDSLVDSDEYAVIDASKQLVKQVAIEDGDRKLVIKIATLVGDELAPLPEVDQVNAFAAYMGKVKDAGTLLEFVNQDADQLKVELDFYYDALLVKSDGTDITTGLNVVETAIKSYLKSIDFNGQFDINRMTDYLQSATGYVSLRINYIGFRAGTAVSYTPISRAYKPLAGYMKLQDLQVNYYAVV